MIRVLVVEDQKIMQKYFEYMLSQEPEFKHVQTVADAEEAVGICSYSAIDIVLMDVQTFHNHDGLKAGKAIREACPHTKILIVTSLIDPKVLERAKIFPRRCWAALPICATPRRPTTAAPPL